jgi:hypothetical protein
MNLSSLQMETSDLILIDMPLIQRLDKDGAQVMEAEIPGNRFASVVRPSLVKGRQVAVRAGTKTYVLPYEQFSKAVDNLSACMERARQRNARRPH